MSGGLYDGLLPPITEKFSSSSAQSSPKVTAPAINAAPTTAKPSAPTATPNAWSSNAKFMASVNLRKKAAAAQSKAVSKPKAASAAPVVAAVAVIFFLILKGFSCVLISYAQPSAHTDAPATSAEDVKDEYEPSRPNDYEDVLYLSLEYRSC